MLKRVFKWLAAIVAVLVIANVGSNPVVRIACGDVLDYNF